MNCGREASERQKQVHEGNEDRYKGKGSHGVKNSILETCRGKLG